MLGNAVLADDLFDCLYDYSNSCSWCPPKSGHFQTGVRQTDPSGRALVRRKSQSSTQSVLGSSAQHSRRCWAEIV